MNADDAKLFFRTSSGAWQVVMTALPAIVAPSSTSYLLPPRRLVLVLVTELVPTADTPDLSVLKALAGLTPAEIAFCRRLMHGDSVTDAADQLGIAVETARTRLKSSSRKRRHRGKAS